MYLQRDFFKLIGQTALRPAGTPSPQDNPDPACRKEEGVRVIRVT